MARGKHTCKILKEIRRQIAEANGIELATSECRYKGDCLGTCPKCEAEVRYLEQQLRARTLAGKAVALAGISAASLAMLMPMTSGAQPAPAPQTHLNVSAPLGTDTIEVRGVVLDGDTLPDGSMSKILLGGATILNKRTATSTYADKAGRFCLPASVGDTLEVKFISYDTQEIIVTEGMGDITVILVPSQLEILPFPIVVGYMPYANLQKDHYLDLNIIDEKGCPIPPERLIILNVEVFEGGELTNSLYHEFVDEQHPCRIYWEAGTGIQLEDGNPVKETIIRIEAEGYDDPVTIKAKYPKRNAKKTIRFKRKKK